MTGQTRGIAFALLAASFYGLVPNVTRLTYQQGIPALESAVIRTAMVAVVLGCVALFWKQRFTIEKSARLPLLMQALATALVSSCYIASVQFIPVGVAVMVFFTFPVLIALAAPIIEGHKISWALLGLTLLAFAGLAIGIGLDFAGLNVVGLVLAALAACGCAVQFFSGRMLAGKIMPAPLGSLVHFAVFPIVTIAMVLSGDGEMKLLLPSTTPLLAFVVVIVGLCYCAAYFCQMSSVAHAPASVVAPYFNLEPVLTTVIAVLLLGETMTLTRLIGAAMILSALVGTSLLTMKEQA